MKVSDVNEPAIFAIEFDSAVGRRFVIKAVEAIPDARITAIGQIRFASLLGLFYALEELICDFKIGEDVFCAFEPFGDSNVYWIRQMKGDTLSPHLARIKKHFEAL